MRAKDLHGAGAVTWQKLARIAVDHQIATRTFGRLDGLGPNDILA
jgi:hypothetical protein